MITITDNIEEVEAYYEKRTSKNAEDVIEFSNSQPYAKFLHDKEGYFVFNDKKALEMIVEMLNEALLTPDTFTYLKLLMTMDAFGWKYIAWLQSQMIASRPPVTRKKIGPVYPGGWSDVRGWLAKSYRHKLNQSPLVRHGRP